MGIDRRYYSKRYFDLVQNRGTGNLPLTSEGKVKAWEDMKASYPNAPEVQEMCDKLIAEERGVNTESNPLSARKFKWTKERLHGRIPVTVGTVKAKDLGVDAKADVLWVQSPKTGTVMKFEARMPLYKVTGHDRAVIEGYRFGDADNKILIDVLV